MGIIQKGRYKVRIDSCDGGELINSRPHSRFKCVIVDGAYQGRGLFMYLGWMPPVLRDRLIGAELFVDIDVSVIGGKNLNYVRPVAEK